MNVVIQLLQNQFYESMEHNALKLRDALEIRVIRDFVKMDALVNCVLHGLDVQGN